MIDAYSIYDMREQQHERTERDELSEWLFDEHECHGQFSAHVELEGEMEGPVLVCTECIDTWKKLYTVHTILSKAA